MAREHAHAYLDAQIEGLVRTLRGYGVLSSSNLEELSGAREWPGADFTQTLNEAVKRGQIRDLGDDQYEAAPDAS